MADVGNARLWLLSNDYLHLLELAIGASSGPQRNDQAARHTEARSLAVRWRLVVDWIALRPTDRSPFEVSALAGATTVALTILALESQESLHRIAITLDVPPDAPAILQALRAREAEIARIEDSTHSPRRSEFLRRYDFIGFTPELPPAPTPPARSAPSSRPLPSLIADPRPRRPRQQQRTVNTGFRYLGPRGKIVRNIPLDTGATYWFWVSIGKLQAGSIEVGEARVPTWVVAGAELTVVVFAARGQLLVDSSANLGRLRLEGNGSATVTAQPSRDAGAGWANSQLGFPVTVPETPGRYTLRCNLYLGNILLQSRLVTAWCGTRPDPWDTALRSEVDFRLSSLLDPSKLQHMGPQALSIFVNENPDGTHEFFFKGQDDFRSNATIDVHQLQDQIRQSRGALRKAAWGSPEEWQPGQAYRYANFPGAAALCADLVQLAIRGYLLYHTLVDQLSGGTDRTERLAELMRRRGSIQLSIKESARLVVPLAMLYDKPLDTQSTTMTVCPAFLAWQQGHADAWQCLDAACPHDHQHDVVCPSGFWGYRHEIAFPVSVKASGADAATTIPCGDEAAVSMMVSLDPRFAARAAHEAWLDKLAPSVRVQRYTERLKALSSMRQQTSHLVYFYCHGGMTPANTPYLSIGTNEPVTPDNLRAFKVRWKDVRPLVFLNGCMTTAVEPEKALDFVSTFVGYSLAAGVVGTEITIFEPLATRFAEAFLTEFLAKRMPVASAARTARMDLLRQGNPLGLVYVAFALPSLRLETPARAAT